jgi:hypothetical protein
MTIGVLPKQWVDVSADGDYRQRCVSLHMPSQKVSKYALGQIRLSFVLILVPGFVLELTNHAFGWGNVISDAEAGGLEKAPSLVGVEIADFQYLPNFWNRLVGRYGDIPGGNRK